MTNPISELIKWVKNELDPPEQGGKYPVSYHQDEDSTVTEVGEATRIVWENIAKSLNFNEQLNPLQLYDYQNIEHHFAEWLKTHNVTHISELILTQKNLFVVPKGIGAFTGLETLYLSDNKLSALPEEFTQLVHLKELGLTFNKFFSVPIQVKSLPNLTELDMSYNKISLSDDILEYCLTKLKIFNLEGNLVARERHFPQPLLTDSSSSESDTSSSESDSSLEVNASIPKGIPNLGLTCYISASLQLLSSTPYFLDHISQEKPGQKYVYPHLSALLAIRDRHCVSGFRTALAYSGFMPDLTKSLHGQKDAAELVEVLLNLPSDISKNPLQSKDRHVLRIRTERKSPDGKYQQKSKVEPFHLLRLPLDKSNINLQELINLEFGDSHHTNDTDNYLLLDNGMKLNDWVESKQLISNPDFVIIQLKRFLPNLTKIMHEVKLLENQTIDLSTFMVPSLIGDKPPIYTCVGEVSHHGNQLASGHYTATVKLEDKWYHYNDEHVTEHSEVSLKDAYLILLKRIEIS